MICPHCHKEITPTSNGKPINVTATRKARSTGKKGVIRYQRLMCPMCLRNFNGGNIVPSNTV